MKSKIRYFIIESPVVVAAYKEREELGKKGTIIETPLLDKMISECYGWGNGYVVIPPQHPMYGENFDKGKIDCELGITFSHYGRDCAPCHEVPEEEYDHYVVGFDTYEYREGMGSSPYTKEYVEAQAKYIAEQLERMWLNLN